mgnify:CR=1 FL=1
MNLRNRMCSLLAGVLAASLFIAAACAAPAPSPAVRAAAPKPVKASGNEIKAVTGIITELYKAYVARDVEKVMALERASFEAAAEAYEKAGKGKASAVIDAYQGATEEVLNHKAFSMKPLNLADAQFQRVGEAVVVTSVVPIISTELVEVGEPGAGKKVRLRIGRFVFKKTATGYQIVRMDFF